MTRVYYKEAVAAIVVFDITNRKTFGAVDVWLKDVNDKLNVDSNKDPIPILLLANKTDMLKERQPCVDDTELNQYVVDNNMMGFFKTSAKDNDQIAEAMKFLVTKLREKEPATPAPAVPASDTIVLQQPAQTTPATQTGSGPPCCRN